MINLDAKKRWDETFDKVQYLEEASKKKIILIIDDDKVFLTAISESLSIKGERVLTTNHIYEFFEFIGGNNLKCVVVDWRMPACGGEKIMRYLDGRSIMKIVISSHERQELPEIGNAVYIKKPVNSSLKEFTDQLLAASNCESS